MDADAPSSRITFTLDEKGQITGLVFKGLWESKAAKVR